MDSDEVEPRGGRVGGDWEQFRNLMTELRTAEENIKRQQ